MSIKKCIKSFFKSIKNIRFYIYIHNLINNKFKINKKCKFIVDKSILSNCYINVRGKNNTVEIKNNCVLNNLKIDIYGEDIYVLINENVVANSLHIWCEDKNSGVIIGKGTTFHGQTKLSCIEGTQIKIGCDCMFSSNIDIVTGDSHSILDMSGKRINPSKSIVIEDHVWVGQKNTILKGAHISKNSIIGAGSFVSKRFDKENAIIAGVPAKIIKEEISWDRKRIDM